ncbi:zinc finger protein 521 [Papilio machaon]|uniref:zinc finger protein 521 n=1 Tax=Papilio machaon TaxID=76193 RepID=UPI001E665825|nr:zinc finger protein 521 [Papilio machaon]
MDDEIDIEEHDVLDNPVIKSIFPDLTKLKQEVLGDYDETSIEEQNASKDYIDPKLEDLSDNTSMPLEENIDEDFNVCNRPAAFIGNKIILGSKPNKDRSNLSKRNVSNNTVSLQNTTVLLKNIKPFLNNCRRYCELCLILFPTEEAYKIHENSYHLHPITNTSEIYSEIIKTQPNNVSVNTCYICNNTFTSISNLNEHVRNNHSSKRIQNVNGKISPKPAGSCFHCNVIFPNAQSLIEHLYDTLGTKKTNEIRNKNALNNRSIFKDVEHSISEKKEMLQKQNSKNFGKVINENDVINSKESETFVYRCRVCSYCFVNVKIFARHMLTKHNIKDPATPKKILYDKKCKFCSSVFPKVVRCNEHIRKIHKNMLVSKTSVKIIKPPSLPKHSKKSEKDVSVNTNLINKVNYEGTPVILYTKDNQEIEDNKNVDKMISESDALCSKESASFVYRCNMCSYWFKNVIFFKRHMLKKHKIKDPASPKKMSYDPKCRFCSSEYSNVLRYNEHIRKIHKKMLLCKIPKNIKPSSLPKIDKNSDIEASVEINSFNKINDKDTLPILETKENHVEYILKSALFRCNKCDIHFLNSQVAIDHVSHMEMLINWKCSICKRIFKKSHENDHMAQHSVTNDFTVYGISESTPSLILYNCPKCSVHFDENKYLQHFPVCETVSFFHVKCKFCGILIDSSLECLHNSHHGRGNILSSGFITVKTDLIQKNTLNQDSFVDTLKSNEIRNKDALCQSVFKDVEQFVLEKNENLQKKDIQDSNKINNIDIIVNKKELRIRNVSDDTSIEENKFFKVYYCKTCKCFVNEHTIIKHKSSKCRDNDEPIVCILCGLIYPRKNTSSHARLHTKKIDLTLQDFEFYDLQSKRLINPPLPEFPQCSGCEIYFPRRNCVIRHCCGAEEFTTCSTCKLKFSELGYKLHMNYHDLTSSHCKSVTNTTEISNKLITNSEPNDNLMIYSCKQCHMSLSNYDLVIEHCQEHLNSDKIKAPEYMCKICNLVLDAKSYKNHEEIHLKNFDKNKLKIISFDTHGFRSDYKAWIKKTFNSFPEAQMQNIVEKSMYKDENKIKMQIIQEGSCDVTLYKCDICNCFIDPQTLIKHIGTDCRTIRNHTCKICSIPFVSRAFKSKHEEIHKRPFKGLKLYRIILFNKKEDENLSSALYTENCFTLYKCAKCNGIVNKHEQDDHLCDKKDLKVCIQCGLLIYSKDFNSHLGKHKQMDTFVAKNMKVIVFGQGNENDDSKPLSNKDCPSKRKKYDYEIYKCKKCQICIRDEQSSRKHVCSSGISKSKCSICGLYWEKNKLKNHYALHNSDSNFVIDNITLIDIDNTKTVNTVCNVATTSMKNNVIETNKTTTKVLQNTNTVQKKIVTTKLYRCVCGIHFLDLSSTSTHQSTWCGLKHKINVRQECSKCGLLFNPNVLFKHLVKHHGNQDITYKFDIIDVIKKNRK